MILFKKEKPPIKCFYQEFRKGALSSPIDLGMRSVDIANIVGSVGRCMDFRKDFDPNKDFGVSESRLKKIVQAMENGKPLPAIELYKVKDEYFVLDGHHRIVAAKEVGKLSLDAHVVEYLPLEKNPENELYREKIFFEKKTNLWGIELSEKESYPTLLKEIENYQKYAIKSGETLSFEDASRRWYYQIYRPIIREIEESGILRFFSNLSPGDLYTCILKHRKLRFKKQYLYPTDKLIDTIDYNKLTKNLYHLLEKDRNLTSNETIREFEKILPPCLYLKHCPHWPEQEKSPLSSLLKIKNIFSHLRSRNN